MAAASGPPASEPEAPEVVVGVRVTSSEVFRAAAPERAVTALSSRKLAAKQAE
jgi:hypothetical protein